MKVKIPDTKLLGCDLYTEVEEEYDGHGERLAKMMSEILKDLWKNEFIRPDFHYKAKAKGVLGLS